MKIFNTKLSKKEILEKIGDISQLCEIKYYEYIDGVKRGVRAIDVKNPEGINFTVLPDRGMDISSLSYKGIPFNWKSPTKEASPIYFESKGSEWLRTFYGGFLVTCGLTSTGPVNIDNGEELSLHGRISNISAENIIAQGHWIKDSYLIEIEGTVREVKVFGDKLSLRRKITSWMDKPKIIIDDVVENIGHKKSPLMILYHINIGYPILNVGSEIIEGKTCIITNDLEAKKGLPSFNKFSGPMRDFKEQCFFHDIEADKDGNCNIAIANEQFLEGQGIGIWLKFNKENLPYLTQWKQMGLGEYVCGIEPCNNLGKGRKVERDEGRLKYIEPGEKLNFRLEFNILKSKEDILKLKHMLNK